MKSLLFSSKIRIGVLVLSLSTFSIHVRAQFTAFDPIVSTFAGTGAKGLVNGAGNVARFGVVSAIKLDSKGNAYVVDASNNCVRKITPAGVVSTFGNTTTLKNPFGLAIDKQDNLYVTDLNNRCIRKITPAGVMSLYAGVAGSAAYIDGPKGTAKFYSPTTIATDLQGNVYVVDNKFTNPTLQNFIRKIAPDGSVSTLVGGPDGYVDAIGNKARFKDPQGMIADSLGNLYVVDGGNNKIRKIRLSDTLVTTFAGGSMHGYMDGNLTTARFYAPQELTFDKLGNFYLTDYHNQLIRKISDNFVSTYAGVYDSAGYVNGAGTLAKFDYPIGIVSDSAGNLLVCDVTNNVIRKISPQKLAPFTASVGAASPVQPLYVSGDNLDGSLMTVKAPAGYEVSLDGTSGFSSEVVLTGIEGSVLTTKVFLRLSANNVQGARNGEVTLVASVSLVPTSSTMAIVGTVSGPLGLENSLKNSAHVYPNPAANELFIESSSDWQVTDCQVVSMDGKLHYATQLTISTNTQSIDISSLEQGIYVLRLSNGKQQTYTTFSKR